MVDCGTRRSLGVQSSVLITSTSLSYTSTITVSAGLAASWNTPGLGAFSFQTTASGYLTNSQSFTVATTTTAIELCVNPGTVQIDVRDEATNVSINVRTDITYSGVISGSFRWNGVTTFQHGGYGSYSFFAIPESTYNNGSLTTTISSTTTLIIIYVRISSFCGDRICNGGETGTTCQADCISLFFEFENADGSGPVNGPTVNYFLSNPRDANSATGPNRNSAQSTTSRTTGTASNTVLEETYSYGPLIYVETVVSGFINFYWAANTSNVDPGLGVFRLRVHLSRTLGANDYNYRVVNTWKPIDATPEPFGPTDLNLHLFHSDGALDINNKLLTSGGFAIGAAVADSKQSGGPATMDISPGSGVLVGIWNSKPPRSAVIAPSQNNRYLVNSGSYVVVYGKTSNAATGKQLGQVVLDQLLADQPGLKSDTRSDLWFVAHFTVRSPAQDQPTITAQNKIKQSTKNSAQDMFFDCEVYSYCNNFKVPFSDTGRRHTAEETF